MSDEFIVINEDFISLNDKKNAQFFRTGHLKYNVRLIYSSEKSNAA